MTARAPMTDPAALGVERVIVLLANAMQGGRVIDEAATLAAALGAEIEGLFLREDRLYALCTMPFARVVRPWQRGGAPLTERMVERLWQRQERAFDARLRARAGHARVACTIRSLSGSVEAGIEMARDGCSIVAIAAPPPVEDGAGLGRLIDRALGHAGAVLLSPEIAGRTTHRDKAGRGRGRRGAVVVIGSGARARAIAAAIAASRGSQLLTLPGESQTDAPEASLARRLRALSPGLIVAECGAEDREAIVACALRARHTPLLLVRSRSPGVDAAP
jgi:hypothetical protein